MVKVQGNTMTSCALDNSDIDDVTEVTCDTKELEERCAKKPPIGDVRGKSDGENAGKSRGKKHLKKVHVSPRVELMLNNELFKKYLQRHRNVLDKLYKRQGATTLGGMKKALSNLDLSKIDFDDDFSLPDSNNVDENKSFDNASTKSEDEKDNRTQHNTTKLCNSDSRSSRSKQRSMSLIGRDDPGMVELEGVLQRQRKNFSERKNGGENNKKGESGQRTRFAVPSFAEFKRMRREKLIKGQEFVKSVINNKENLPLSLKCGKSNTVLKDIEDEKFFGHRRSCPDISICGSSAVADDVYTQNVKQRLKSVSEKMENTKFKQEEQHSEKHRIKSSNSLSISKFEQGVNASKTVEGNDNWTNTEPVLNTVSLSINANGKDNEENDACISHKIDSDKQSNKSDSCRAEVRSKKSADSVKKFHRSRSFNEVSSANVIDYDSCRKSNSSRQRKYKHSMSLSDGSVSHSVPEDATDPLEMSTDGTNVYVVMKINSFEPPCVPLDSSLSDAEIDGDHENTNLSEEVRTMNLTEEICTDTETVSSPCSCSLENNGDTKIDDEILESAFSNEKSDDLNVSGDLFAEKRKGSSRAIVRLREMQKSCEESARLAGISLPKTPNNILSHHHAERPFLRASRKRKLPSRPTSRKSDSQINADTKNNLDSKQLNSQHPISKSSSESKLGPCFEHEVPSPGCFSFPNSPAANSSTVFVFPSPTASVSSSENDVRVSTGSDTTPYAITSNDSKSCVIRSTSDVSDVTQEAQRRRRHRKQRPYKSDPFSGTGKLPNDKLHTGGRSRQTSLLKDDFNDFPDDVSLQEVDENDELQGEHRLVTDFNRGGKHRLSNMSDVSTDSGVIGQESLPDAPPSPSSSIFSQGSLYSSLHSTGQDSAVEVSECPCYTEGEDIDFPSEKVMYERKETILEIRDTEINYGRDLKILKEEFYKPMKNNGLLSSEQLEAIFLNMEELLHVNTQFTDRLEAAVDMAKKHGDENLTSVVLGDLFLKSTKLILTFEHYCVNQSQATILLEQLEREKELLRIFLKVCQDEHAVLRRMHLKSFLMVPVQRIMKYPLLLERLYKATPPGHVDRDALLSAKNKIESILEHINAKTKSATHAKLSKRKSNDRKPFSVTEKIQITRVAMEVLGWHKQEVCEILTSQVMVAQTQTEQNWATKRLLRNVKFTQVHAILLTLGQGELQRNDDDDLLFPQQNKVIQAAVVLIKEKNGKFQKLREPLLLNRCVVNVDSDESDTFELMELNKESFLFKCDDPHWYKLWLQNIKQQTLNLGSWRKRRNALPNIMIKHLIT